MMDGMLNIAKGSVHHHTDVVDYLMFYSNSKHFREIIDSLLCNECKIFASILYNLVHLTVIF